MKDILLSRQATKGIQEYEFKIRGIPFRFFDVGGQRSQRQVKTKYLVLLSFSVCQGYYSRAVSMASRLENIAENGKWKATAPHFYKLAMQK